MGNVPVGGDAPITVQTMTNTLTSDAQATIAQLMNSNAAELRPPLAETTQSPRAGTSRGAKFVSIVQLAKRNH